MKLFEPGKIGPVTTKNRLVMAAMSLGEIEPDGRLSLRGIDYYVARAKGGVGLMVTSVARASRLIEQPPDTPFVLLMTVDSQVHTARWSMLADAVHDYGTKVFVQLTAGYGRVAPHSVLRAGLAVAPSASSCYWDPRVTARELTTQEVEKLAQDFAPSAELLRAAGIDGVELHGHEGYLFDQFQTALWNHRKDKYGGDLEGRLRFAIEVVQAIKKGAGADFPVVYRYGLTHYLEGGRGVEEGLAIARRLEAAGVDALHIDAGCYETWYWPHPPTTLQPGAMVDLAEMTKKAVNIPVIAVGKLGYPELAERVLQEGKADFVAVGRALLADPEWPNKVKGGRSDIRPCIGDHICLERARDRKYMSCTVNPLCGLERELTLKPAEKKRAVLVVGGGPAGMEAARAAAVRGHNVTLWEKSDRLGGNLVPAAVPDFKDDYRRLIDFMAGELKRTGVRVELGKEATPALVQKAKADAVIIATGSTHLIPSLPGVDGANVITAVDLLMGKKGAGKSVVMVGGGLVGCETALYLAQQGKQVTIIKRSPQVMADAYWANREHVLKLLAESEVRILTGITILKITDREVAVSQNGKEGTLPADTVVLAAGLKSNTELYDSLKDKLPEVHAIGDCVEPRKVVNAIWEGFRTARLI